MSTVPSKSSPPAAVHLLNRAAFGPRPGEVREVVVQGHSAWLKAQLAPVPDPNIERRLAGFEALSYPIDRILAVYRGTDKEAGKDIVQVLDDFYAAKLIRAVHSKNQLQEVVTDFWFNHFNVNLENMFVRQSVMAYERDAIRPHVFGKFRALLGATAQHPAMLFYLDNHLNKKNTLVDGKLERGVNENYGRELLELHTVGVTAGYTQEHVVDAARCLTGWTIDDLKVSGKFLFKAEDHDTDAKHVFGLSVAAGGGIQDGEKLLDYLALHPATARFICTKLARRFASDDPPASLVERCAQTFLSTGGDIAQVLLALFTSEEFWAEAGKPKLKTPIEYVVSSLRAVNARVDSAKELVGYLANMGMQPYFCGPPTGYSDSGGDWLSPLYLHRLNFALDLAAGGVAGVAVGLRAAVRQGGGDPQDLKSVIDTMNREIFAAALSPQTLATLAAASKALPATPAGAAAAAATPIAKVVGLLLASPEMQAR